MTTFATYLHHQTTLTSKSVEAINFTGHSLPYFDQVRQGLELALKAYPTLPVRRVDFDEYHRVHTQEYLHKLKLMARDEPPEEMPKLGIGCDGLAYCIPGYEYSLGGMYEAIDVAQKGTIDRVYCFSLGGHHAFADWGHGYCIVNPQAVAARYTQAVGFEKILIIDWDLHHGDGTQSIFACDNSVYCISIHSVGDLYMTVSQGIRYATTVQAELDGHCNIPVLAKAFEDDFFERMNLGGKFYRAKDSLHLLADAIENIPWQPDYLFIFSGYDAHINDKDKGVMNWTNNDYQTMTKMIINLAKKASCPILSVHGGGYNLSVAVEAATGHVEVLASYR